MISVARYGGERKSRRALTAVELMVVVSIIGVLLALTTVAVQSARETSRRMACQDKIRQLQLATMNFESSHRELPQRGGEVSDLVAGRFPLLIGPFAQIAPFFEVQVKIKQGQVARELRDNVPMILRCPTGDRRLGYRFNAGTDWHVENRTEQENGPVQHKTVTLGAITDGLSNTAILSERLAGDGTKTILRSIAFVSTSSAVSNFDSLCLAAKNSDFLILDASDDWSSAGMRDYGYHHTLPPNSKTWDCDGLSSNPNWLLSRLSARSLHGLGVNLAMLDGSVQLVHSEVDVAVWRAWGTIASQD